VSSAATTPTDDPMRSWILPHVSLAAFVAVGHATAPCAGAQAAVATPRTSGATVRGVVRDSLSHTPLSGATVQLVTTDTISHFSTSGITDSAGRYALNDVPDGRFLVGFLHPLLDSLGVEAPLRELRVDAHRSVRFDLATPSPARLRAAICGAKAADSSAVLVGVVRDARSGSPLAGAAVTGEWMDLSFTTTGLVRRRPHLVANTGENGWFALCNVPRGGTMLLLASRGADSTDLIEVQIPAEGFQRRELYIGPAQSTIAQRVTTVPGVGTPARDSTMRSEKGEPARRVRTGDGRVSGTVRTQVGDKPLPGARVSIADGPQVLTNERGEWTIGNAPAGTRVLEVRAVGYYPEHRKVDVVAGAPPVRVALATFKAALDTVRVTAASYDRNLQGFLERSHASGAGRFLTAKDVARRGAMVTSDVFRSVPGLRVEGHGLERELTMRSAFGACKPEIFLNGQFMPRMEAEDIDDFVTPERVTGIEVYPDNTAPPQFQNAMSGCGSIVIWYR
jgi:hypothetical protein